MHSTKFKIAVTLIYAFVIACFIGLPISFIAFGSDLQTQESKLYPLSTVVYQTDFLGASVIPSEMLTFNGTTTTVGGLSNRPGILRRDTSAVINTIAALTQGNGGAPLNPSANHQILHIIRLNNNDANTTVRIGSGESPIASPPTNGIYLEKLDADVNWFCVTRSAGVQTRTDSTIAVTVNFDIFSYTRNSTGVQFSINKVNVCGVMTTNIPTAVVRPFSQIINSAAVSKTMDYDYFHFQAFNLSR